MLDIIIVNNFSYCMLMGEVTNVSTPPHAPEKLIEEVIKTLWSYALESNDGDIVRQAYKTLGCFTVEQVAECLPDTYKLKSKSDSNVLQCSLYMLPGTYFLKYILGLSKKPHI